MSQPLRIAVEGNIGVGKSTLLPKLCEALPGDWDILTERVDEDPEFCSLLDAFYKDPNKNAQLQSWITHRRLREFQALESNPKNFLFERSFLGELVFCHANLLRHEKPDGQFVSFYYNVIDALKKCRYDAVVYLKASPKACFDRIRYRAREAGTSMTFDYVQYLHQCYQVHLPEAGRAFNIPVLTLDWENFGNVDSVVEQITTITNSRRQQAIAV